MSQREPSLKSVIPLIAPMLRLSNDALYERQRLLVRKGVLPSAGGRGRGNGAKATEQTVALLIAAVLISDNLSDIGKTADRELKHLSEVVQRAAHENEAIEFCRTSKGSLHVTASLSVKVLQSLFSLVVPEFKPVVDQLTAQSSSIS